MSEKSLKELNLKLQTLINPSPLQRIRHPLLEQHQVHLSVKRDDLLHGDISGNKWRKLKFNLIEARSSQINHILSFGGAYSNHIHALAAAGFHLGFKTSAVIRGEAAYVSNPTLKQAAAWGMNLQFVTRKEYRQRNESEYLHQLQKQYPDAFIVPEGGSNIFALAGLAEAVQEIQEQSETSVEHIITATGSGGTLAGLISAFKDHKSTTRITGIAVLKNADYLNQSVHSLLQQAAVKSGAPWELKTQFHHGGYAKVSEQLISFCRQFSEQTSIPVEPVYTGKMFYALFQLIKQGYFKKGEHIVALHTGGLQGLNGLKQRGLYPQS
ncbi:1-aminocyclopropane-1-carboxylate deaminase/D-cysteine desulfhydrase [Psychromonas aquimarina]|uniref:1-aminocyclopropane-1-carboxylate deaminase/D-cysteine desulfhydrase n=1 Tax=Psychromonas aquimarina TaxID=444919 RepID=UPI0004018524|nr:pyridoxal-phosphate dependent enzyme [Psychromonas aquimarina]